MAKPFLKKWLAVHQPKKKDKKGKESIDFDAPLFINRSSRRMSYDSARMVINRLVDRIGLKLPPRKKTHIFRHLFSSRAKWPADVKDYWMGWSGRMSNRYTHIGYKDCVKYYFDMVIEENNPMLPRECKCGHLNPNIDFCVKCGQDLKALNILHKTPERRAWLVKDIIDSQDEESIFKLLDAWWDKKKEAKK